MTKTTKHWWGEFQLTEGRWAHFEIGPLSLYARRVPGEWRFAWLGSSESLSEKIVIDLEMADEPDFQGRTLGRYAMRNPGENLLIMPRLADRAVVVRPETPLYVLAQEQATLYVSTPVWLALSATGHAKVPLTEIPSFRPSETWFGANTRVGESCYASKTGARTDIQQVVNVPHRAVTPIVIHNDGEDSLAVEQLRVPVSNLALYTARDGRLWTDTVQFVRETGESSAVLRISKGVESLGDDRSRIAEPRAPHDSNPVVQAFSRFFG